MAILGLEERIIDRAVIAGSNYNTSTSDYNSDNYTHTSNYAPDSYSYKINFGDQISNAAPAITNKAEATTKTVTPQTILTNSEPQTDNALAGLENIAIAYSPVYDVETKHQVPDASFSYNRDEVYIFPEQCGNGTNYMIFRPTENVSEPLELEEGFYYAHADELDGIEQALQSIHDIKTEMIKYEASGQLERLIEFAQVNGINTYILRQPDYYGATSEGLAIAYTFYHKHIPGELFLLGAGKNFYDSTYNHGLNLVVHPDYGIVDAITEELLHQVQPEWMYEMVVEHGYMELLEGHVKALKSKYFFELADEAPDEDTRHSYSVLSAKNYAWYRQLMGQHVGLYGIEIDEGTLEEMLDTYSPEDVVKVLSEGATREPNRCAEGGYGYATRSGNKNIRRNNIRANSKIGRAALMVERQGNYFSGYAADDKSDGDNTHGEEESVGCGCAYDNEREENADSEGNSDNESSSNADGQGNDCGEDSE